MTHHNLFCIIVFCLHLVINFLSVVYKQLYVIEYTYIICCVENSQYFYTTFLLLAQYYCRSHQVIPKNFLVTFISPYGYFCGTFPVLFPVLFSNCLGTFLVLFHHFECTFPLLPSNFPLLSWYFCGFFPLLSMYFSSIFHKLFSYFPGTFLLLPI